MNKLKLVFLPVLFFYINSSLAGVVLSSTRVIYPEASKEVTLKVTNEETRPALAQIWLDDGDKDAKPQQVKVPFFITPAFSRIDGSKSQSFRIFKTEDIAKLPKDRESIFYLNVLDIPPKSPDIDTSTSGGGIQFSIRSRIKLFYRPTNLKGVANQAPSEANIIGDGNGVIIKNNTPFHLNLQNLILKQSPNIRAVDKSILVPPFESKKVKFNQKLNKGNIFQYESINDLGGIFSYEKVIQ